MAASIWAPADGDLPITTTATTATQTFVAGAAQTLFTLTTFAYAINTQSLLVFKNGLILSPSSYTQTSTTSFTLVTPATGGDIIIAYAFTSIVGVAILWKGAYSAIVTYAPGNVVSYLGASYICILQTIGNLPISVTYWSLLADRGVAGAPGAGTGDMLAANNLSELIPTKATARTNLGATPVGASVFTAVDAAAARAAIGALSATGLTLISRTVAVAAANVTFSSIAQSTYDSYLLVADNISGSLNATGVMQFGYGGVIDAGASSYESHVMGFTNAASTFTGGTSQPYIALFTHLVGSAADQYTSFEMRIFNNNNRTQATWQSTGLSGAGVYTSCLGGGKNIVSTAPLSDIRLYLLGGTTISGTFSLYGLQKT